MGFCEIWVLSIFRKSVEKIQVSLKSDKNNGYFTWRPIYIFDHFLIRTYILCSITSFQKNHAVYERALKKCWVGQGTDDSMAHPHCRVNTWGNKHTQNMQYLLLFHCHNGCTNAPLCCVIRTLPALFAFKMYKSLWQNLVTLSFSVKHGKDIVTMWTNNLSVCPSDGSTFFTIVYKNKCISSIVTSGSLPVVPKFYEASPRHVGVPSRLIIWYPFKNILQKFLALDRAGENF